MDCVEPALQVLFVLLIPVSQKVDAHPAAPERTVDLMDAEVHAEPVPMAKHAALQELAKVSVSPTVLEETVEVMDVQDLVEPVQELTHV